MKLKIKISLIAIIVTVIINVIITYSFYQVQFVRTFRTAKQSQLERVANVIRSIVRQQTDKMAGLAHMLADLPQVKQAMRAGQREDLWALLNPLFAVQRDRYDVSIMGFTRPPATVFLRLHKPEKYGDDISFRELVLTVNKNQEARQGIEIGRAGLGIRALVPISDEQGFLGSVEVGSKFTPILQSIKQILNFEAGVFVNETLMSTLATEEPQAESEQIIGGLRDVEHTNRKIVRAVVWPDLLRCTQDNLTFSKEVEKKQYGVVMLPLQSFNGRPIGFVIAVQQLTWLQSDMNSAIINLVSFSLLQLISFIGLIGLLFNGLLIRPLLDLSKKVNELIEGELEPGFKELAKRSDEVGELAGKLEKIQDRLTKQRAEPTTAS